MSRHDDWTLDVPFEGGDFDSWELGADGAPLSEGQLALQAELSCLADGELDEARATAVMLQLEEDAESKAYFDDIRRFAGMHRDVADPSRLMARLAMMTGADVAREAESIELNGRLATIFYKLGKAYLLAALSPDAVVERAFEAAVPLESTQLAGRGFVDGVLMGDRSTGGRVDWREARKLLNGRLERIEDPLEKSRRLLLQAVDVDPSHEEARFYLAYLAAHEGKRLKARELYQDLFDTAVDPTNRGHAAIQLGRLFQDEEDWHQALVWYRWIPISGTLRGDTRFWVVRFNIAMSYLGLGDRSRSLDYFRALIDSQPDKTHEMAHMASQAPMLRTQIERDPGFGEALASRCPELFGAGAA